MGKDEELKLRKVLRVLLNDRRLTMASLAKKTGVSRSTLNDWTQGSSPRSLSDLRAVARYLEVPLEYLLFGDGSPDRSNSTLILDGVFKLRLERIQEERGK